MPEIIDIAARKDDALARSIAALAAGEPVAIPTETVYGLAADATNPDAISRIYEIKKRPQFNPLICHVADMAMARRHAIFDEASLKLAETFWPGPLTLVLPLSAESDIHPLATAGLDSAGIRMPEGFARTLISAFGKPLAAPSANRSGRVSPTTADHVAHDLEDRVGLVLDGGPAAIGVESTIIKVEDGLIRLLRPGGVAVSDIEVCLGRAVVRLAQSASSLIVAPGMMASHYAPHARVRLNVSGVLPGEVLVNFANRSIDGSEHARAVYDLSPTGNLREAAANLFTTIKLADQLDAAAIAFAPIPDDHLGEAINDRLRRAAAPRDW